MRLKKGKEYYIINYQSFAGLEFSIGTYQEVKKNYNSKNYYTFINLTKYYVSPITLITGKTEWFLSKIKIDHEQLIEDKIYRKHILQFTKTQQLKAINKSFVKTVVIDKKDKYLFKKALKNYLIFLLNGKYTSFRYYYNTKCPQYTTLIKEMKKKYGVKKR